MLTVSCLITSGGSSRASGDFSVFLVNIGLTMRADKLEVGNFFVCAHLGYILVLSFFLQDFIKCNRGSSEIKMQSSPT